MIIMTVIMTLTAIIMSMKIKMIIMMMIIRRKKIKTLKIEEKKIRINNEATDRILYENQQNELAA